MPKILFRAMWTFIFHIRDVNFMSGDNPPMKGKNNVVPV